jgi:DNA-directed RNA polymerase specialized sigma24 family protein
MPLERDEIDRLLTGLPLRVREEVEKRLSLVSDAKALSDLIEAAKFDERIAPMVERAKKRDEEGRRAFDELWREIGAPVRNTIRVWVRYRTPEDVEAVESQTMELIWLRLPEYVRDQGFFLSWARAYAKNQARWYKRRTVGVGPAPDDDISVEGFFELPPSACYSELLDMVQDRDPCEATVFLLNKYLDWKPAAIASTYGHKPLAEVVAAIQAEIVERFPILVRAKASLSKLLRKALQSPKRTLQDCVESGGELIESITRWASEVKRSLGLQIISQAKDFLRMASDLSVAAHEKLAFLWSRFLRRDTDDLCAMGKARLLDLLEDFCSGYSRMTDLSHNEILACTRPLRVGMEKAPTRRLADCSKGDLCEEVLAWRTRIQTILLGPARDRHLVAYSYLCGCLPGVDGPAKRGV